MRSSSSFVSRVVLNQGFLVISPRSKRYVEGGWKEKEEKVGENEEETKSHEASALGGR